MNLNVTTGNALLRSVLRAHGRWALLGTLLRANHQVMEALVPVVVGQVIDRAIEPGDGGTLVLWLGVLLVNFVVLSASWFFGARILDGACLRAEHEMRVAIGQRVLAPAGIRDGERLPGELLSIATSDADRASWIIDIVATAAGAIAALLVATAVLLRISLPLGLLVILGALPLLALIEVLGRVILRHSDREQAQTARAAALANDFVTGQRVLKGFGGASAAIQRYRGASQDSLKATLHVGNIQAVYDAAALLLTGGFLAVVAYVGARLAASGQISIGDLIAAIGLTQFLIGPMYRLAYMGSDLARCRASARRVAEVLATQPAVSEPDRPLSAPTITGSMSVANVTGRTLQGVSFDVGAGEMLGVVALDQADGESLVEVLARSTEPSGGTIHVDGREIESLPLVQLRRHLVVSRHDAHLFSGTVMETLTCLAEDEGAAPDLDQVIDASALADVIAALPGGTEARIGERGQLLSGGQRQRLSLARALAAGSQILVLEEPTSAVDSVTESKIAGQLRQLRANHTTIIVTSSPALLAATDRVVVIEEGRVTAIARHGELLATNHGYRAAIVE